MAISYYYYNCHCWQNWLYSIINHANLEDAGQVAAGDVDAHVRLVFPLHLARQQHLQGLLNNYFPLQYLCLSWIEPLSLFHRSQRGDTRWHRSDSRCTTLNIPKHQVKHSIKICTMGFRLQSCFLRENCLEASLPITMAHLWCFRLGLCIVLGYSFANFVLICNACRVWTLKHHLSSLNDAVEIGALLLLILASCPHSFNINCFSRGGMDAPLDFLCQ